MRQASLLAALAVLPGCFAFVTKEEGSELKKEIEDVRNLSAKNETRAAELANKLEEQLKRMKEVVDQATQVVQRNSADVGQKVDKLQVDVAQLTGRVDDQQHQSDGLTKSFQDYRAATETKLEQLTNTMTVSKTPPIPETADGLYAEAEKRFAAQQWQDARRLYDAFINKYPQDARAAKAQFAIGEAFNGEKRYSNAIGAYAKVVDNFPKSDVVPEAMFKSGVAFYQLKYCGDAKVWLQELLKRYPKTALKKQVEEQLRTINHDQKNKAICAS